jgi:hypothetical protein
MYKTFPLLSSSGIPKLGPLAPGINVIGAVGGIQFGSY